MSAHDVYSRLTNAPSFHPSSVELFDDFTLQAGDIVTVRSDGDSYSLPIYRQHIHWNGSAMVTLESTGNTERQPIPALERKIYRGGAGGYANQKENEKKFKEFETWRVETDELIASYAAQYREDMDAIDGRILVAMTAIEQNATEIALRAYQADLDETNQLLGEYYAEFLVTASSISSRLSDAEGNISTLIQTASSLTSRITDAEGNISTLIQTASSLTSRITDAEGNISTLTQTASSLSSRMSTAEGYYSTITQTATAVQSKVSKGDIASTINQTAQSVLIQASKIDLDGYVTVSDLNATNATISNLTSGITHATALTATTLQANTILNVAGSSFLPTTLKVGSIISATVLASSRSAIDLNHYHSVTATESNGNIVIKIGQASLQEGSANFSIAATQTYIDGVAAATQAGKDAMGVTSSWNDNVLTFRVTQSTTKSDTVTITASHSCVYNPTTHQYTVTGSAIADGETVKTSTATGSGTRAYDDGVLYGEGKFSLASVTLQGSAHADITPIGTTYKYTYTHLYKAGTQKTYYKEGTQQTYYKGNGGSFTVQGTAYGDITPIKNAVHFKSHPKTDTPTGSWYEIVTSGYNLTYYSAGSVISGLRNPGTTTKYARGDSVSVTEQGDSVSVTEQGDTQYAYVADSEGSVTRYGSGTKVTGLYNAGSTVSDTYYTKNS